METAEAIRKIPRSRAGVWLDNGELTIGEHNGYKRTIFYHGVPIPSQVINQDPEVTERSVRVSCIIDARVSGRLYLSDIPTGIMVHPPKKWYDKGGVLCATIYLRRDLLRSTSETLAPR